MDFDYKPGSDNRLTGVSHPGADSNPEPSMLVSYPATRQATVRSFGTVKGAADTTVTSYSALRASVPPRGWHCDLGERRQSG